MFYRNLRDDKEEILPLTEMQKEIFAAVKLNKCDYLIKVKIYCEGDIAEECLRNALSKLVHEQQALRTIFRMAGDKELVQVLLKDIIIPLYIDLDAPLPDIENEPWNIIFNTVERSLELRYCHIVMDGWGMSIFWNELLEYYSNLYSRDVLKTNRAYSLHKYYEKLFSYNKLIEENSFGNYFFNVQSNLSEGLFPVKNTHHKSEYRLVLSEHMNTNLLKIASNLHVTQSMIFYSAWGILLSSFTGKEQIAMGIITSGRDEDLSNTVGMFIQKVPLCVRIEKTLEEVCLQVKNFITSDCVASANKSSYISTWLRTNDILIDYDTLVVVENYPLNLERISKGVLRIKDYEYFESPSNNITLQIITGRELEIVLSSSNSNLCNHLEMIANTYVHILEQIGDGCTEINHISMCSEIATSDIIYREHPYETLNEAITKACKKYAEKIAIIEDQKSLTYRLLYDMAKQGASNLRKFGIKKNDVVGVSIPRSIEQLISVYAIILAGGIYVPFTNIPIDRANYMIQQAEVCLMIGQSVDTIYDCKNIYFDELMIQDDYENIDFLSTSAEDTAYILFTSGSTGRPKGCEIAHRAIVNRLSWNATELQISTNMRQLYKTPTTFDVSLIEIFSIFFAGHTLYVLKDGDERFPEKLMNAIYNEQIDYVHFVPSMLKIVDEYISAFNEYEKFKSIKLLVCSGEILPSNLVKKIYKYNDEMKVVNLYGPTEAAVDVSFYFCPREMDTIQTPIGRAIDNTVLLVLDKEKRSLPLGVGGEIYILGDNLGKGYINQSDLTNKYFIKLNGQKAYRTGDYGYYLEEGEIVVVGRIDEQIKYNGIRIEPAEIENELMRSGLIYEAVVVIKKENPSKLIVFYRANEECEAALRVYAGKHFQTAMIPNEFIYLETFPLTVHNKINKKKLLLIYDDISSRKNCAEFINGSLNDIEKELCEIWSRILNRKRNFNKNDHFFACGGNSISLIRMIVAIQKKWGIYLSSALIYEEPTIEKIANEIERLKNNEVLPKPLSVNEWSVKAKENIALYQINNPESTAYNMPILLKLSSDCSLEQAKNSLLKVLNKYDWLHKIFIYDGKKITERIDKRELTQIRCEECEDKYLKQKCIDFVRPFKLDGRLFRVEIMKCGTRNYILLDFHHLLCDQTVINFIVFSWIISMEKQELPETVINISREGEEIEENIREVYDSEKLVLNNISLLFPNKKGILGRYYFRIEEQIVKKIDRICEIYRCSRFQFLLAAFFVFCGKISGKTRINVGTNTTGDQLISQNMQLHTLTLGIDLKKFKNLEDILKDVKHVLSEVMRKPSRKNVGLFDVMFIREEDIFRKESIKRYVDEVKMLNKESKYGLSLFYKEEGNNIDCRFDYDKGFFQDSAIIYFGEIYNTILKSLINVPDKPVLDDKILDNNVEQKISNFSKGTEIKQLDKTVQELFAEICKKEPDLVIAYENNRCITRGDLYILSARIANELEKLVEPDTIVGVLMPMGIDYLATIMGILMAGCVYLPLDITNPIRRNKKILIESNAAVYICDRKNDLIDIDIICREFCSFKEPGEVEIRRSNNTYCIFTSGSTGKPKQCIISQKNILNYLLWANNFYCEGKKHCFALFSSPAVDMTITSTLLPLVFGHSVVIYPQVANSIISAICDKRITILKATPSHLELIKNFQGHSSISKLIVGGEQLTTKLVKHIKNIFEKNTKIYNEYGPTEATVACMIYQYSEKDDFLYVPIGKPIQNFDISIRDNNGKLSLLGTQGQIVISGVGVIEGYANDEVLTKSKFKYLSDGRWSYETGDKARMLADGNIIFEGRVDEQYKLSGYRVELSEIAAAAKSISGVENAYSIIEEKHLLLFVKLSFENAINEIELRQHLFELIPHYMMPSQILIISEIPLMFSGKIDREHLVAIWRNKQGLLHKGDTHDFIRRCWAEELETDNFSDEDGFLEIGGNSLSIVSLQRRLSSKFPNITVADLFCYPSVATLTDFLSEKVEDTSLLEIKAGSTKVVISGVGFELPDANDLDSLRHVLKQGKSCARVLSGQRIIDEQNRLRNMGWKENEYRFSLLSSLSSIDCFDYEYFHISKDEAEVMEPTHKVLLSVVDNTLANAGIDKTYLKGSKCAVIIASPEDMGYSAYLKKVYPSLVNIAPLNNVKSSIAARIAYFYDLHGPTYLLDSACSSGLVALELADTLIKNGDCEMAIVGGVNLVDTVDYSGIEHSKVLSPYYHANSFSADADGTARGEGCICYYLEKEEKARSEGRAIYAAIEGSAINNDGFSSSLVAPNGKMQEQVIRQAIKNANISPDDVDLIETHGTATPLGDAIELQSLISVMSGTRPGHCAISAAKSVFGHLDSISGLLGVLKCIVSIRYKELYPIVGMRRPIEIENLDIVSSAFYFPNRVMEWAEPDKKTLVCGISSYGLSGTNVHVVLSGTPDERINTKHVSRLKAGRCWLPEKVEMHEPNVHDNNGVIRKKVYDKKSILSSLIKKVSSLYSEPEIIPDISLYQAGFDSVSVIQLKLFIKNKYGVDIEVSAKDTLEYLAGQIEKLTVAEQPILENIIRDEPVKKKENYENTWFDYQVRYSLLGFLKKYVSRTPKSRMRLLDNNLYWANGRFMTGYTKGMEEFSYPILMKNGSGVKVCDIDDNQYIDFAMGFGSNLFGYKHPYITEKVRKCVNDGFVLGALMDDPFMFAKRICKLTGVERISFCGSGTEAIMNLIRIARAATGKEKIVIFEGSFHGTFDPVYVQKNDWSQGEKPLPRSIGTPIHYLDDIIMLKYGDFLSLERIRSKKNELAAVLVEPIQSRHPNLRPKSFIKELREITEELGILLIFDEVITGFRNGIGGAQAYYEVQADLVAYGKVIGGGYPIGIFGGKAKYLDMIDHRGGLTECGNVRNWVSTGGTFNAHPISIIAGNAVLDLLEEGGNSLYERINNMTSTIMESLNTFFRNNNFDFIVEAYGSQFIITGGKYNELRLLQYLLISRGIYVWEGGTCFVSAVHTWEHIYKFIEITKECVLEIRKLIPLKEPINVRIDPRINARDYLKIKEIINRNSNISEIRMLEANLLSVLSYNISQRVRRADYAMMHICVKVGIDESKIKNSLNKVVNFHQHLRSGLSWRKLKSPIKLIYKYVDCPVEIHHCLENEKQKVIENIISVRRNSGFDLEKAPLLFFDVFISETKTDVVMSYYNSWIDGWSADVLLQQIGDALIREKYPNQSMDWNEYESWKEQHHDEKVAYWKNKDMRDMEKSINISDEGEYYEVRKPFPECLNTDIRRYCEKKQISLSALYISAMANVMNKKCIMTSLSGRGMMIPGIMTQIGLFSSLVPILAGNPEEINRELVYLNNIPICSYEEMAELIGVNVEILSNLAMTSTIVIQNQYHQKIDEAKVLTDESYVYVPFRCYILPEKEILITGNTDFLPSSEALKMQETFFEKIQDIIYESNQ